MNDISIHEKKKKKKTIKQTDFLHMFLKLEIIPMRIGQIIRLLSDMNFSETLCMCLQIV